MKAVLDANVLYPATLRSLLLDLALLGGYQPYWTDQIQAEWQRNLLKNRPDLQPEKLQRTQAQMEMALPNAALRQDLTALLVTDLPDPDDAHVLAAARQAGAAWIVTANLRDFPADILDRYGIQAIGPDAFLCSFLKTESVKVKQALIQQRDRYKNPPVTVEDLLSQLSRQGVSEFARRCGDLLRI